MARYINADALQAKINGISDYLDPLSQLELVCDAIAEAPTADVREVMASSWIPVAERLPDKDGLYLVTLQFETGRMVTTLHFDTARSVFGNFPHYWNAMAWMPLPKPYKADKWGDFKYVGENIEQGNGLP